MLRTLKANWRLLFRKRPQPGDAWVHHAGNSIIEVVDEPHLLGEDYGVRYRVVYRSGKMLRDTVSYPIGLASLYWFYDPCGVITREESN